MGIVQKIFYLHVPAAIVMNITVVVCALASLGYLIKGTRKFDEWAISAGELAVVFGAIVLITGPLWGRKAWGIWWDWRDVRLTSTAILFLIFVAYLFLRSFGGAGAAKFSAAFAFFAPPIFHSSTTPYRSGVGNIRRWSPDRRLGDLRRDEARLLLRNADPHRDLGGAALGPTATSSAGAPSLTSSISPPKRQGSKYDCTYPYPRHCRSLDRRRRGLGDRPGGHRARPARRSECPAAEKKEEPAKAEPNAAAAPAPTDDRTGFVAVKPGESESVSGGTLLVVAYAVVWALLFFYVVSIYQRQRKLEGEVEELNRRLKSVSR